LTSNENFTILLRGAAAAPWKSDEEINEKQRIQGSLSGCKNVPYKLRKSDFLLKKAYHSTFY
jgi:hypothetical protein